MGGEQLASIMLCHGGRKAAGCISHGDVTFLIVDPPAHFTIARCFDKTVEEDAASIGGALAADDATAPLYDCLNVASNNLKSKTPKNHRASFCPGWS